MVFTADVVMPSQCWQELTCMMCWLLEACLQYMVTVLLCCVLCCMQRDAQESLRGTTAELLLKQTQFKALQGRVLDFSDAKAHDLRPWKRACLAWGRYSHHAMAQNETLEPSAQGLLHLLSLDRISDFGAKQHLMSWLDHLPVPEHLLQPQLAVTPPAEPVQPSPVRRVPATSSLLSSNSSTASQKQQPPGSRLFQSALKAVVNPAPVPK